MRAARKILPFLIAVLLVLTPFSAAFAEEAPEIPEDQQTVEFSAQEIPPEAVPEQPAEQEVVAEASSPSAAGETVVPEGKYSFRYRDNADGTVTVTGMNASFSSMKTYFDTVIVPPALDGKTVSALADDCLLFCGNVKLPSTVKMMGWGAFRLCEDLKSITVDAANTNFSSVDGVLLDKAGKKLICYPNEKPSGAGTAYTVPNGVTSIEEKAFFGASSYLTKVTLPGTVASIGAQAFSNSYIDEINIPASMRTIGESAFYSVRGANKRFTFEEGVTGIGANAFNGVNIPSLTLPGTLRTVGSSAFKDCGIKTLKINSGATVIGDSMFSGNTIGSLYLPPTIKTIGSRAFENCGLTSVNIPGGVADVGYMAFAGNGNLSEVTVESGVKSIQQLAFQKCRSLKKVMLPGTVTAIYDRAFEDCSQLGEITIPASVTIIGTMAFRGCPLGTMVIKGAAGSYAEGYARANNIKFQAVQSTPAKPATPSGLKAASAGYSSVRVSWNTSANTQGYYVYRAESKTGTYKLIKTIAGAATTGYTDKNLVCGKIYYYKVAAYDKSTGATLKSASAGPVSAKPIPARTASLKAASNAVRCATLQWGKVEGANGYLIYRSASKESGYTLLKTITSGSTTSWTNTNLTSGNTYYYKVTAYRSVGGSKVKGTGMATPATVKVK